MDNISPETNIKQLKKRRSSILKVRASPQEKKENQICKNKKRRTSSSRRVSFATTHHVKEFPDNALSSSKECVVEEPVKSENNNRSLLDFLQSLPVENNVEDVVDDSSPAKDNVDNFIKSLFPGLQKMNEKINDENDVISKGKALRSSQNDEISSNVRAPLRERQAYCNVADTENIPPAASKPHQVFNLPTALDKTIITSQNMDKTCINAENLEGTKSSPDPKRLNETAFDAFDMEETACITTAFDRRQIPDQEKSAREPQHSIPYQAFNLHPTFDKTIIASQNMDETCVNAENLEGTKSSPDPKRLNETDLDAFDMEETACITTAFDCRRIPDQEKSFHEPQHNMLEKNSELSCPCPETDVIFKDAKNSSKTLTGNCTLLKTDMEETCCIEAHQKSCHDSEAKTETSPPDQNKTIMFNCDFEETCIADASLNLTPLDTSTPATHLVKKCSDKEAYENKFEKENIHLTKNYDCHLTLKDLEKSIVQINCGTIYDCDMEETCVEKVADTSLILQNSATTHEINNIVDETTTDYNDMGKSCTPTLNCSNEAPIDNEKPIDNFYNCGASQACIRQKLSVPKPEMLQQEKNFNTSKTTRPPNFSPPKVGFGKKTEFISCDLEEACLPLPTASNKIPSSIDSPDKNVGKMERNYLKNSEYICSTDLKPAIIANQNKSLFGQMYSIPHVAEKSYVAPSKATALNEYPSPMNKRQKLDRKEICSFPIRTSNRFTENFGGNLPDAMTTVDKTLFLDDNTIMFSPKFCSTKVLTEVERLNFHNINNDSIMAGSTNFSPEKSVPREDSHYVVRNSLSQKSASSGGKNDKEDLASLQFNKFLSTNEGKKLENEQVIPLSKPESLPELGMTHQTSLVDTKLNQSVKQLLSSDTSQNVEKTHITHESSNTSNVRENGANVKNNISLKRKEFSLELAEQKQVENDGQACQEFVDKAGNNERVDFNVSTRGLTASELNSISQIPSIVNENTMGHVRKVDLKVHMPKSDLIHEVEADKFETSIEKLRNRSANSTSIVPIAAQVGEAIKNSRLENTEQLKNVSFPNISGMTMQESSNTSNVRENSASVKNSMSMKRKKFSLELVEQKQVESNGQVCQEFEDKAENNERVDFNVSTRGLKTPELNSISQIPDTVNENTMGHLRKDDEKVNTPKADLTREVGADKLETSIEKLRNYSVNSTSIMSITVQVEEAVKNSRLDNTEHLKNVSFPNISGVVMLESDADTSDMSEPVIQIEDVTKQGSYHQQIINSLSETNVEINRSSDFGIQNAEEMKSLLHEDKTDLQIHDHTANNNQMLSSSITAQDIFKTTPINPEKKEFEDDFEALNQLRDQLRIIKSDLKVATIQRDRTNTEWKNLIDERSISKEKLMEDCKLMQETKSHLQNRIEAIVNLKNGLTRNAEWTMKYVNENVACFVFFKNNVDVQVEFDESSLIVNSVEFKLAACNENGMWSKSPTKLFQTYFDQNNFKNKYLQKLSVVKLLQELSLMSIKVKLLSKELMYISITNPVELLNLKQICVQFFSYKKHMMFKLIFHIDFKSYPESRPEILFENEIGSLSQSDIINMTSSISTGPIFIKQCYLAIEAFLKKTD